MREQAWQNLVFDKLSMLLKLRRPVRPVVAVEADQVNLCGQAAAVRRRIAWVVRGWLPTISVAAARPKTAVARDDVDGELDAGPEARAQPLCY